MSARAMEPAELPIVVTGAGVVTAAARGRAEFRAALDRTAADGRADERPRTRIEGFDATTLPEAKSLRRAASHVLFGIAAGVEALAEADARSADRRAPEESALLLASTLGAAGTSYRLWHELLKSGPLGASPMLFSEGVPNAFAGHAARLLRLLGPGHMVVAGSDSGLRGLALARDLLECGRARRVVVGAAEEASEVVARSCARFGILRREGAAPRPMRGLPMGEGAAMLCLERGGDDGRDRSRAPALAVLSAVESMQLSSLRGAAARDELVALFERACAAARVRPSELRLASAANSTPGDRLEAAALERLAPRGVSQRVRRLCGEAFSVTPLLQVVEVLAFVEAGEPAAVLALSPFAGATLAVFSPPASEGNG